MYRSDRWLDAKLKDVLSDTKVQPLVHWIEAARKQPPVLFVGAGFSLNAKAKPSSPGRRMKSWSELTEDLKKDLGETSRGDDSLWIAEKFKRLFTSHVLHSRIEDAVPDAHVEPGPEHLSLRHVDWHSVLTLNYDTLLERALEGVRARSVTSIISQEQAVRITGPTCLPIVHLHGHIDHPSTIVLTLEDFRRYPEDRGVFLTIARQLLLQHPVLFLGFGASDPNFVTWSGWIRDRVGEQSPPWLRLEPDFGRIPDAGMEAYWGSRLQTVRYPPEKFVALFEVIGRAVDLLDEAGDEFLPYIDELVELTRVRKEDKGFFLAVLDEVEKALEGKYPRPLDTMARTSRSRRVTKLLHAGLERAGLSAEAIKRLTERSRESLLRWLDVGATAAPWLKTPPEQLPTLDEQKSEVRSAMGEHFLPWLLFAVRLAGRFIPLSVQGETFFDGVEEYRRMRQPLDEMPERATLRRRLGLSTLKYELERLGPSADEPAALDWLEATGRTELSAHDRAVVDDLLRRNQLLRGHPVVVEPAESENAQGARLVGYLAMMEGRFVDAADAYERATTLSITEGEPLPVQYMTAASAEAILFADMIWRDDRQRLTDERRAAATERVRALRERAGELRFDIAVAEGDHASDRAKQLAKEVDALRMDEPDRTVLRGRSEPLAPVLDFFEEYLFAPTLIEKTAADVALAHWADDDTVLAAAILARYGSDELEARARADTKAPRKDPLPTALLEELLRAPRWPHERRARIAALAEVVPELRASQRSELLELSLNAFEILRDQRRMLTHHHTFPGAPAVKLGVAIGRQTPWVEFKRWIPRLEKLAGEQLLQLGAGDWLALPVRWWTRNDSFRGEEAEAFFAFLFRITARGGLWLSEDQVVDVMSGLILHHKIALPRDGEAARAFEAWLGDPAPQNDGDEWLRTEAAVALGVLRGHYAGELRSERALRLRALVDGVLRTREWPNPYVVRAWLACFEELCAEDAAVARRLLAVPFSWPSDGFENPRATTERRMGARARLLMWSRLALSSEDEHQRATAFLDLVAQITPDALSEFARRDLGLLDPVIRDRFYDLVCNAFNAPLPHRERTESLHGALSCLAAASKKTHLAEVPVSWLFGAGAMITAANPHLAAYACIVVRNCLMRWTDEWSAEHGPVLNELRRALLRGTLDGRAYVAAAARRGLLDVAATAGSVIREYVIEHVDTRRRLEELTRDTRLAVVVAGEAWTRDAP